MGFPDPRQETHFNQAPEKPLESVEDLFRACLSIITDCCEVLTQGLRFARESYQQRISGISWSKNVWRHCLAALLPSRWMARCQ